MNQKGPPGLGLQTGSMLTFWSIIKGEMMRGDFVFYTKPTLLFKKKQVWNWAERETTI